MKCRLYWNKYKYFPYEKILAVKEIESLLNISNLSVHKQYVECELDNDSDLVKKNLSKLTYFSKIELGETVLIPSQTKLEQGGGNTLNGRQATRYSAHGIHEYKGKFNPQVVKSILNIFNIGEGQRVIDPFSGSGTTILECSLNELNAIGLDINPLAVLIANAKQKAISTPAEEIKEQGTRIINRFHESEISYDSPIEISKREEYLLKWLPKKTFCEIEFLRETISEIAGENKNIFIILLSNLIRDYSNQEPGDLRIRKRKSPFPEVELIDNFEKHIDKFVSNMKYSQSITGLDVKKNSAIHFDVRNLNSMESSLELNQFDLGITSPPYATALPYIDTQRLSLVWLDLVSSDEIMALERELIGSREFKKSIQNEWRQRLESNLDSLPQNIHEYCLMLLESLGEGDGFRRQAVPMLLYRYFSDMYLMFKNLLPYFKSNAKYALIVGHNHTVLGGKKIDINTPELLVEVAIAAGWSHEESMELQTYQRYGIHQKNAVNFETLIVLSKK